MSHIAKCCKCKRMFYMPDDILYTEAICGQCQSHADGTLFGLGQGKCNTIDDVIATIEANAGDIDGGRVEQMYRDWYDE